MAKVDPEEIKAGLKKKSFRVKLKVGYLTRPENVKIQFRLPFKNSLELLGNSFEMARKPFLSVERRLERDLQLENMYIKFMDEYLSLGGMLLYKQPLVGSHFVIPHH